jgi:hypothetical protein
LEAVMLFFEHDAQGAPNPWNPGVGAGSGTPQFPSPPLRETRVALVETPPRWRW